MTIFTCKFGSFRFEMILFGLMNVSEMLQRMKVKMFKEFPSARDCHDDYIVYSSNHIKYLYTNLKQVSTAELHLKRQKCSWACNKLQLLWHFVFRDRISVASKEIKTISEAAILWFWTEFLYLLSQASYNQRFMNRSPKVVSAPLQQVTSHRSRNDWNI